MIKRLLEAQNNTGECPVWLADENALYWADIPGQTFQRYIPEAAEYRQWTVDEFACGLVPRIGGGLVAALQHSLNFFDPLTGSLSPFAATSDKPFVRNNDMKCDPQGRLWVGTMNVSAQSKDGALYRVEPGGKVTQMLTGIGIANTLAWSPDEATFYFGDTSENVLWAFDYDAATGDISNRRVFFEGGRGGPDGSAIDSEGYLWNARYGGGCVLRIAPDGTLDKTVEVPAQNPTSCAFGGPDLRTLFITSAGGEDASGDEGAVFVLETGVAGQPVGTFKG